MLVAVTLLTDWNREQTGLTFLFSSKVLRPLTPSGHNDPVCWDVDNCDKKTRDVFFTSLLHEIELVIIISDD